MTLGTEPRALEKGVGMTRREKLRLFLVAELFVIAAIIDGATL